MQLTAVGEEVRTRSQTIWQSCWQAAADFLCRGAVHKLATLTPDDRAEQNEAEWSGAEENRTETDQDSPEQRERGRERDG